jgi:hypothetical protein
MYQGLACEVAQSLTFRPDEPASFPASNVTLHPLVIPSEVEESLDVSSDQ